MGRALRQHAKPSCSNQRQSNCTRPTAGDQPRGLRPSLKRRGQQSDQADDQWKAPSPDFIPAEEFKFGGAAIKDQLTSLYRTMWNQEQLPQEFRDATIVHIYKRSGNRQCCDNHWRISLLSIAGKILALLLLNCLLDLPEQGLLPESPSGLHAGRGTTDMIFAARQLEEKCMEQQRDLYTT